MSAALSQPDADRFSIFIDQLIDAPRFSFSAFCQSARISAAEALAWFRRPDIESALQSCIKFIQDSARIRHAVLDTNAMGALGQLLHTSDNQIEIRRAATTIIARHKADLRASRPTSPRPPRGTSPSTTDPSSDQNESGSLSALHTAHAKLAEHSALLPRHNAASFTSSTRQTRETKSPSSSTESAAHSSTPCHESPPPSQAKANASSSFSTPLSTPNSAPTARGVDRHFLRALALEAHRLRKEPPPREPRSARSLLARAGAPPPAVLANRWLQLPHSGFH